MMRYRIPLAVVLTALCAPGVASAQVSANAGVLTAKDQAFVASASQAGAAEVAFGLLASSRATSDKVKTFALRMVSEHRQADVELANLADGKGDHAPSGLTAQDAAMLDVLAHTPDPAFDVAYLKTQVAAHDAAVVLYRHEASVADDGALQSLAAKTLPMLEMHLSTVRNLYADLAD